MLHLALPLLGLWLLIARPTLDVRWQHHPSHFWLVMAVAAASVWLGLRMQSAARQRSDARLLLVALAFITSAGFLFLHALATPGVLLDGPNIGFEIATPVGLALASGLLALSAFDLSGRFTDRLILRADGLRNTVLLVLVVWAGASVSGIGPLDGLPTGQELQSSLEVAAFVSVGLYAVAAAGYFRIHRRRPSVMLIGLITAAALLGEAMTAVVFARNWQLSWWLWHILMAAGFGFFSYSAYVQFRREGSSAGLFNALTTEETVEQIRSEYGSALESLTSILQRSERSGLTKDEVALITSGLASRFGMSEGQTEVLGRAAEALATQEAQARRLAALAEVGLTSQVRQDEHTLLSNALPALARGFGGDIIRFGLVRGGEMRFPTDMSTGRWGDSETLTVPITIAGNEAGVVEVQRPAAPFTDRDRSLVETLAAELSIALENVRLYEQVEGLFRRYMSPDVATALLADPSQANLGGAVVEITSLFADLRGFTSFSERSSPEEIVEVLNRYFGLAVPCILDAGGTVVQFIGDALLAVFNAPARQSDHQLRACTAALAMQEAIGEVVAEHDSWPLFRIGVNTGPALVGNIGSDEFRSFNVMGDAVNVAARLEGVAEPGSVVIGGPTYEAISDVAQVESLGELELKGKEQRVAAYRLLAIETD
jgi:class 3 adenylate cyclase